MEERNGWVKIRERLLRGYEWAMQIAKRKSRRRSAMEGIIMGIRRGKMKKGVKMVTERERLMVGMVKRGEER